jgi:hypothetical protein
MCYDKAKDILYVGSNDRYLWGSLRQDDRYSLFQGYSVIDLRITGNKICFAH